MPIPQPQIPNFTVTPTTPLANPLDHAAKIATLKNMLSDQALRQQLMPLCPLRLY